MHAMQSILAENLTAMAADQQRLFEASTSRGQRRETGHFGTSSAIAEYMAWMFEKVPQGTARILDPGAGVGMLSAAVCQRIIRQGFPRDVHLEVWENDLKLEPFLRTTMAHCEEALRRCGHHLDVKIHFEDFILANTQATLFDKGPTPSFHMAILNPPYYKVRKESLHARSMRHVIHGQPNIYALFMAVAADLLLPGGEMVAITPRSYFNGLYFRRFRKWFFDRMAARQIHVFESRTAAFQGDDVLQENVILAARKGDAPKEVILTTSHGGDLRDAERRPVPYLRVIEDSSGDHLVRVTANAFDDEIIAAVDGLPQTLRGLGFEISTGPVVSFRATDFLRHEKSAKTAPLLWMHNVRPFITRFPKDNGKPAHILVSDDSRRLLLPSKRYVLLKRFTAKEEKRRLVAGIFESCDSYSPWIGLENHLNYVHRKGGDLSKAEAFGLAAYFNSALVDRYFRAMSGNTQVNASEIRSMPLPSEATIIEIGELLQASTDRDGPTVERLVGRTLRVPDPLVDRLCEAPR